MPLLGNINNDIRSNLFFNRIRGVLKGKHHVNCLERNLEGKKVFFITGYGRSGTELLAYLLNRIPGIKVEHEPMAKIDMFAVVKSLNGELNLANYNKLKLQYLSHNIENHVSIYGEVNSYLRHHIVEIGEFFKAKIGYILRDGRDVVRSMMNRSVYKESIDPLRPYPERTDNYFKEFKRMSRFEKCCWAWAVETDNALSRIREKAAECKFSRFEEFTNEIWSIYDICNYFGIKQAEHYIGEKDLMKKINVSPSYAFPRHDQWPQRQREHFNRIAGEVNVSIGYGLA